MRAYERFIKYAGINTMSNDKSMTHPSFKGEFDLGYALADELKELGLSDVRTDDKCYVYGFLPAAPGYEAGAALGFIAHMDTSDGASGENVNPILHENYDGEDVEYPLAGKVMKASEYPELKKFKGETLITSDGRTLLGSDDKAGIAEIMTAIQTVIDENIPHGPISIAFTPDEEIGEGADYFDVNDFKADFAYTVDGGDIDCIEYENFNAASAIVTVTGFTVHPGDAKDKMKNAINIAHEFHLRLPAKERPEHTEGREGFYHLESMEGTCGSAKLEYLIRDHDRDCFENRKDTMRKIADELNAFYGSDTVHLDIKDSYYNMLEMIRPHMHLVDNAAKAIRAAGCIPTAVPIRGGTDGARLSYMGLPCPNLGTGGYNFHGVFEFNSVERMDKASKIIVELIKIYSNYSDSCS